MSRDLRPALVALVVALLGAACAPVVASPAPPVASPVPPASIAPPAAVDPPTVALAPPKAYAPCPIPSETNPEIVLVVGDSLAWEAVGELSSELCAPNVAVHTILQPGAALCDLDELVRSEAVSLDAGVVVLQFSGNNVTPCTAENGIPLVGDALVDRYEADAALLTADLSALPAPPVLIWASAPGAAGESERAFTAAYQRVIDAASLPAHLADVGIGLRDSTGIYRGERPCLTEELGSPSCRGGMIAVRHPIDGYHLCPAAFEVGEGCPVYNAGAVRFGRALALPVRELLGLGPGRAFG